MSSKKTILKGTLILTIAGIATKLLGFYNRIFLTRLIGVKELGIYQLIFPLYLLAFSFCCQGISTTLTKQISFYIGQKKHLHATAVFRYSLIISVSLSFLVSSCIWTLADPLALHILKNTDCAPLLKVICIAIPFVSAKSCINSYFIGMEHPGYHGFSHFIEQVIRIGSAYVLSLLWSAEHISSILAVTAVVIGEISATIIAIICYCVEKKKATKRTENILHPAGSENRITDHGTRIQILKQMLTDAIPITGNNLMFTLFSSLEAIIMPSMLYYYYLDNDMALEMFGIINGIVIPFLLFPSTITTSLSTMLLPAVSYANATQNKKAIRTTLTNSITFCVMLGMVAWLGYLILGPWACNFAFKNKTAGIILRKMSFLCPLIYLSGSLSAMMNGLDMAFRNLIYNIIGISIRIICSMTLVPVYGISAYICGMTASYSLVDVLMLTALYKRQKKISHT